ncbi:hypothetical protein QA596_01100 [Balneolales bacterium ANBcel1]|nr:hypothetical protein [Balneolales bacterium ANBcel1]
MSRFLFLIFKLLLLLNSSAFSQVQYQTHDYHIDFSGEGTEFVNYWNGTGFTPGSLLFRKDMQLTLDYQAAVPNQGMRYVRPHWLLNLVTVQNPGTEEAIYHFDRLFEALDEFVSRGMKPVFEIMGFPMIVDSEGETAEMKYDEFAQGQQDADNQWVPDFEQQDELMLWYDFVVEMISELEDRYGREELESWYFESTNEPDMPEWFWDLGIPALLNYWDATSEAIKAVNENYLFGGPGTALILSDEFKAVIEHADRGTNAITGEQGSVLDFISVHNKNLPYDMVESEMEAIDYIREHHPGFRDVSFWNNEADPTFGWLRPFWWRPKPWYAGFIVQSVDAHNRLIMDAIDINYGKLINDKGFLGDWYTRTALARFANEENEERFWLIKKPVHNAMSLLAHMPGRRYQVQGYETDHELTTVIPVRKDNGQIVMLVSNMPEFGPVRSGADSDQVITPEQKRMHDAAAALVNLTVANTGIQNPVVSHIRIDDVHANPYQTWIEIGRPEQLDLEQYEFLTGYMEPVIMHSRRPLDDNRLELVMSPASVSMIIISEGAEDAAIPRKEPEIASVAAYEGFHGERKEFVRWEQATDDVVAYDVYASHDGGEYARVNPVPVLDLGFLHVVPDDVDSVSYRIRIVDL